MTPDDEVLDVPEGGEQSRTVLLAVIRRLRVCVQVEAERRREAERELADLRSGHWMADHERAPA